MPTDDSINIVRQTARDRRFLPGGGAVELELARRLHQFAEKRAGLEQYAINAFGDALEVIPRTLAENAGLNGMNIISQLYASHEKGNVKDGVDIENGGIADLSGNNIVDHLGSKSSAFGLAVNTATTILRVDTIIMAKPAGGPKMPKQDSHWDDAD